MRHFIPLVAALVSFGPTVTPSTAGPSTAGQEAKDTSAQSAPVAEAPVSCDTAEPALGGYCPVAYVAMNQAVKGDPQFSVMHEGHRYLFANADAKKMFVAEPSRYRVAYGGFCATAMAMGHQVASDPKLFTVSGGATYLFSTEDAKKMWDADGKSLAAKADGEWAKTEM